MNEFKLGKTKNIQEHWLQKSWESVRLQNKIVQSRKILFWLIFR